MLPFKNAVIVPVSPGPAVVMLPVEYELALRAVVTVVPPATDLLAPGVLSVCT